MTNKKNTTINSNKVMNKMTEQIERQALRINKIEQQFMELASRVSTIENI